jgi:peptide/nickel transport system substrate-binding protein
VRPRAPVAWAAAVAALLLLGTAARAEEAAPQRGGTLIFSVTGEPDTYDCHASVSVAVLHRLAPHHSLLLQMDPARYPEIGPDLAESWSVAPDGLSYTFKLHRGVKFHDGSPLTAADVKATYERLRKPPAGTISARQPLPLFADIAEITTPDGATVVFRLSRVNAAMPTIFAGPWNCVYSAARLAADPDYPARKVMGSGPFRFVEHVAGAQWVGARFEDYFKAGKPYLDGFRAVDLAGPGLVNALAAGQTQADFRGLSPAERDRLVATRGERIKIAEGPQIALLMLTFNTTRKPFDDARVRRALSLAIDRWGSAAPIGKLTFFTDVGGFQRPGAVMARPPAEFEKMPGFGRDMATNRAEARRLLAEAGVANLSFTFTNRPVYTPVDVLLVDQWRQIGVTVKHEQPENAGFFASRQKANFDVIVDALNEYSDDPSLELAQFLSVERSPGNISRSTDMVLDSLYDRQAGALDPAERLAAVRDFEARLLTEAYSVPLFWGHRIIPLAAELQGYALAPNYFIGQDLAHLWLQGQAK